MPAPAAMARLSPMGAPNMEAKKPQQQKPAAPPSTAVRRAVDFSPMALSRPAASPGTLKALFESPEVLKRLQDVVPKHVTPDRLMKVFLSAILKTPALLTCTQASLVQSVVQLGELGLDPSGGLGFAYLVPYKGTATAIIGYRGYIELARRSGQLSSVRARVVHQKDVFRVKYGLVEDLEHIPSDAANPGDLTHAYCIAEFKDGGHHMEVMSKAQIDAIRARSKAADKGPWVTDYEAMAQKTVIRRAAHFWPLSPELGRAMEVDEEREVNPDPFGQGGRMPQQQSPLSVVSFASAGSTDIEFVESPAGMDPATGEVPMEDGQVVEEEQPQENEAEPDDPVDALLWRIKRATKEQVPELTKAAGDVPKDDARRGAIGKAMSDRRKELGL
jgi:recombination protein RecT